MPVPSQIIELVQRFHRNLDLYKRQSYKEACVRIEFIDPFFEALGWDVRNVQGYSEQYKDLGSLGIVDRQRGILLRRQEGHPWSII